MNKHLYAVLNIHDPCTGRRAVVVCETATDEADVMRSAHNAGHTVNHLVFGEVPITLNDYQLA